MTKEQLKQELKDKVKEGVKPSDIRKLKRSKSLGDIPKAPPLPTQPDVQQLEQENQQLKAQLAKVNADWTNLAQKRVENLKESPNPRIKELETKLLESQQELNQTVKDATEEINRQENEIKQLRTKLTQTTQQKQDLAKQIKEYQRAAKLRITEPNKEPSYSAFWADYGLIILCLGTYCLSTWMLSKNNQPTNQ
ncbi:hypothetical protein [endosymbiont GvMRE of Glomus versiforme]|uniref:hypothetical protein n=1 Tax=endosymbiont GvMRE of Glomus versiforme TaxID=2039283 RepID=UPI000ECFCFEF|nr:hypothetical protein [endosymbiont GvMRE of Glomus versiforme]RHZ35556.1 hypothetical protein GvMRE_IIg18 [endosymbiont GvMRE of Glomus versiforme]